MNLKAKTINKNSEEIKTLFYNSFPENERFPLCFLLLRSKMDFIDFLSFHDNDTFIGLTYLITNNDLTYIFYLATDNKVRSKGYGSRIIHYISELYPNNTIILNIETVNENSINYKQRVKREQFYFKNGYRKSNLKLIGKDDTYDILIKGRNITTNQYNDLFKKFTGNLFFMLLKPKLISI